MTAGTENRAFVLDQASIDRYRSDGFFVLPGLLGLDEIERLRSVTDEVIEASRSVAKSNDVYDLEDTHTAAEPRVRRIKKPYKVHPEYARAVRHPKVVAVLQALWGPNVRLESAKLNMKSAGYGAAVEWHQDWAFYPHTNDDVCAVGVMMDDTGPENAPLMILPGSHKGPIYDHRAGGNFVGAIDPEASGLDFSKAVPILGGAGTIVVFHVRAVHGSAPNTSGRDRRLLLLAYRNADAWPILGFGGGQGYGEATVDEYDDMMIAGTSSFEPRMEKLPVRLPFPPARNKGSIYENQRGLTNPFFKK